MGAIHPLEHFDFDLSQETRRAIEDMGYDAPTPIQALAIAPLLEGKDVIGQAQTGTGKTAAFGIPIIEKIDAADRTTQALVVCPTRELAVQTAGEALFVAQRQRIELLQEHREGEFLLFCHSVKGQYTP